MNKWFKSIAFGVSLSRTFNIDGSMMNNSYYFFYEKLHEWRTWIHFCNDGYVIALSKTDCYAFLNNACMCTLINLSLPPSPNKTPKKKPNKPPNTWLSQ